MMEGRRKRTAYQLHTGGVAKMSECDASSWERARLIPVSGIRNAEEQERRATSALLAVLAAVPEFGLAITKPYGALKGRFDTYIEVPFELPDGRCCRPDGLIRTTRGKRSWTTLLEVKTGANELKREQIETYLDLAKDQGFDCVLTISNQIARIPGTHPVEVDKRKLKRVALNHLSWSRIRTEAVLQKSYRGVADPDQAWILEELIRYLEHPNAGAVDFRDMGEHWVGVRTAVKNGTLRHSDKNALEVAGKWEELVSFVVLRLGRQLGAGVEEMLSAKERDDIAVHLAGIIDEMVTRGVMTGEIRIPSTVGNIALKADLRAQQIVSSVSINAPRTGKTITRINWLLRQLKSAPPDIRLESWRARSRSSMSELLGNVRGNPSLLIPIDNRELVSFTVSLVRPMGLKRSDGQGSFIFSVLETVDDFYGDVVQHMKGWQPPAPKLQKAVAEDSDFQLDGSAGGHTALPGDNDLAGEEAVLTDSSGPELGGSEASDPCGN